MSTIPRLHDATLETLTFHWEVVRAVCPRALPWGPSDSVNEVKMQEVSDARLLSVEMQSGDVLEISCREVLVKSAEQ
jgi:hypothetical protein